MANQTNIIDSLETRCAQLEELARDVRDLLAEAIKYLRGEEDDIVARLVVQAHEQLEQFGLGDGDPDREEVPSA